MPPNLLSPRQRCFARRMLPARQAIVFLKLISTVERRKIERGRQACSDAEAIDRRAVFAEPDQFVFIDAPARKYVCARQAPSVQDAPNSLGKLDEIAAVEPHCANRNPLRMEEFRKCHDLSCGRFGVVGVDQKNKVVRPRLSERKKSSRLIVKGLDEGMSHGAVKRTDLMSLDKSSAMRIDHILANSVIEIVSGE